MIEAGADEVREALEAALRGFAGRVSMTAVTLATAYVAAGVIWSSRNARPGGQAEAERRFMALLASALATIAMLDDGGSGEDDGGSGDPDAETDEKNDSDPDGPNVEVAGWVQDGLEGVGGGQMAGGIEPGTEGHLR